MMEKYLLEVDSIRKHYNHKPIVTDVYLKCETGNIIGLLGHNGCGKSTLLKIIFGIVKADFKFIRVNQQIAKTTSQLLKDVSYLSQENFIPKHFSVEKAIGLSIEKVKRDDFYNDPMISGLKNKTIGMLSGGELRYLEIKLILQRESKFVLLDEPYNGLSPLLTQKISGLIVTASKTRGIIISDHNYENVLAISTSIILMKDGKTHPIQDKYELVEKGYLRSGMI